MISNYEARQLLESQQEVNIKYWTKKGEVIATGKVVCTSSFKKNNTFNILFIESREVRKLRAWNIFELNGQEVCI
jgi:hypothetical protein